MRSLHAATKSSPCSPRLEKACVQQRRPNADKNKFKKKSFAKIKRSRVFSCVLITFWLATLPISFASWPYRHKGGALLYPALFCSEDFYYKCKTHVIPAFLNLEADSFKVTLWILFIHIPWFYHNLFWQASWWRLVPHNHNPEGKKLGLLIQSQKYFIFQLVQKHQLYFPSTFFYSEFRI